MEIKSWNRYLSVENPNNTTTDGLLQSLKEVLKDTLGIEEICDPLSASSISWGRH